MPPSTTATTRALARVLTAAGVPHEVLPAAEAVSRWGVPADGEVLWQPTAGVLAAEQVVVAAGGWLPDLLGDLSLPAAFLAALPRIEVRQERVHHFPYRDAGAAPPSLIHRLPGTAFSGLPGGRDAGHRGDKVA